jgi:hypothetical protein
MDPDPDPSIILLSSSKNRKKNLDSYFFVTSFGLLIFDPDPDLLVRGMDSGIRMRIHTKMSWIQNTADQNRLCP